MASLSNAYCDPFSSWGSHVISRPSTGAALHEQAAAEELCAHDALQPEWAVGNGIIGSSPALVQILDQVKTVAPLDSTVLIQGETGTRQLGRFELADKGTLFLDEIGDMLLELPAKLLRVPKITRFQLSSLPHTAMRGCDRRQCEPVQ